MSNSSPFLQDKNLFRSYTANSFIGKVQFLNMASDLHVEKLQT